MKVFYTMLKANFLDLIRDRAGLFWLMAFPLIFIFLFGIIFSGDDFAYVLPGILGMGLMQLGLFGSLKFLGLREQKIIRGLGVTPVRKEAVLISEFLLRLLVGFVQAGLIIIIGQLVFDITYAGSLVQIMGIVLLGTLVFISLGYMLITFASSTQAGNGLLQVAQFPMMLLSGIFFPVNLLPEYMQPVVKALPLTYLGDALRQVMVGAAPYFSMTTNLLVLGGWLIGTAVLAIRFWRWE